MSYVLQELIGALVSYLNTVFLTICNVYSMMYIHVIMCNNVHIKIVLKRTGYQRINFVLLCLTKWVDSLITCSHNFHIILYINFSLEYVHVLAMVYFKFLCFIFKGFSESLLPFFRDPDGKPLMPRSRDGLPRKDKNG